jgi:hypothetical protein
MTMCRFANFFPMIKGDSGMVALQTTGAGTSTSWINNDGALNDAQSDSRMAADEGSGNRVRQGE